MNVTTPAPWRRMTLRRSLERNHLERHAKHLGRFLSQRPIRADLIICPAQSTPDDLLTQELRQKRAKADDVRHRVAVPPFSQHPHADDASHVSAGRMIGSPKLLRQFFETTRVHRMTHAISRPRGLAYGIKRERTSSVFASPESDSCTTLESTRIVWHLPSFLNPSIFTGGTPVGARSSANHS